MKKKQIIKALSLKDFLSLFDAESILHDLELGDTWHPSSGFVDESILENRRKVSEILAFSYDFKGLVHFKCHIDGLKVELKNDNFEVVGHDWKIRELKNQ